MQRSLTRNFFKLGLILLLHVLSSEAKACGGMIFPGSLLCSSPGSLVYLGTLSPTVSPTAYPPNFIKNKGGGYTAVYPSSYSPSYSYPSYGYPSSYSYLSPFYSSPSSLYPGMGMGSLLYPSLSLGGLGGLGGSSCNTPTFGGAGPYFGLGSYGGYTPSYTYINPGYSSCGMSSLVPNHVGSSCGSSPAYGAGYGTSPRLVCVMCGLARNLMRPISRARTLSSNRFY